MAKTQIAFPGQPLLLEYHSQREKASATPAAFQGEGTFHAFLSEGGGGEQPTPEVHGKISPLSALLTVAVI